MSTRLMLPGQMLPGQMLRCQMLPGQMLPDRFPVLKMIPEIYL